MRWRACWTTRRWGARCWGWTGWRRATGLNGTTNRGLAAPGSAAIIVSGFETPGAGLGPCLQRLAQDHDLRLYLVTDGPGAQVAHSVVCGRAARVLNASDPPEAMAARLAAPGPGGGGAAAG